MDPTTIAGIPVTELSAYIALTALAFNEIRNNARLTKQQKLSAETALAKAFNATEGYYAKLATGAAKDIDKEHAIAALWDETAAVFVRFNEPLGYRLGLKSRFWREGAAWSAEQIKAARISLDEIRSDGRRSARKGR